MNTAGWIFGFVQRFFLWEFEGRGHSFYGDGVESRFGMGFGYILPLPNLGFCKKIAYLPEIIGFAQGLGFGEWFGNISFSIGQSLVLGIFSLLAGVLD